MAKVQWPKHDARFLTHFASPSYCIKKSKVIVLDEAPELWRAMWDTAADAAFFDGPRLTELDIIIREEKSFRNNTECNHELMRRRWMLAYTPNRKKEVVSWT